MNNLKPLLPLLLIFALSSCKNFFKGDDIKDSLNDNIDYAKSKQYTVFVNSDAGTGSFIQGNGTHAVKINDSFTIEFTVSSSCRFIEWRAVDKNNTTLSRSNCVYFSHPDALKTDVTLLSSQEDILIYPYCCPYLSVTAFSPEYKESGVCFNSDISIIFSNYLDESAFSYSDQEIKSLALSEEQLLKAKTFDGIEYTYGYIKDDRTVYKNIQINFTNSNVSLASYFDAPVIINGNTLLLAPKKSAYEDFVKELNSTVKEITVTLSRDIFDISGLKISDSDTNISFTYAINENIIADTPTALVTFNSPQETGTVSPSGIQTLYTGISYNIEFIPDDDYFFKHWGIYYASGGSELDFGDQIVKLEDKFSPETKLVLTMPVSGIMLQPVCLIRPKVVQQSPSSIVSAHTQIMVTFSAQMDQSYLRWSYEDINDNSIQTVLRDTNQEIYGYVTTGGEHFWHNIQITSSTGQNLLKYFEDPVYTGGTLTITAKQEETISSNTTVIVKINKSVCDTAGTPCGSPVDYIEFSYIVN